MLDTVGQILWYSIFLTPILTIPVVWKFSKAKKIYRLLIALLIAVLLSTLFYAISMAIVLRDGLGPT